MRNNKKLFLIAGLISVSMLTGCGNATEKEDRYEGRNIRS